MSDSYQAIYDAVRSRISHVDIGQALEAAMRDAFGNADHQIRCVAQEVSIAASAMQSPSVLYRPAIFIDGDMWCALYGKNFQEGVCGFGESPEAAMQDFNKNWYAKLEQES